LKIYNSSENIDKKKWENLLREPNYNIFFQSEQYYNFLTITEYLMPFVHAIEVNNKLKALVCGFIQRDGGLFKQFFSRRAIIIGGPIITNLTNIKISEELLNSIVNQLRKKTIYIEIRNLHDTSNYKNLFLINNFFFKDHYNYIVDTTDFDIMKSRIKNNKLRQIRKSLRNGARIKDNITPIDISRFYLILQHLYKTKVKKPLFPLSYFQELYKTSFCKFLLVEYNDRIVGGIVLLFDEDTVYEHYICGENKKFNKIHPSVLATWAGLEYAANNGFEKFDFMGAGKPKIKYGVRDFKRHFGGDLVNYGRYIRINKPLLYKIGKLGLLIKGEFDKYIYLLRLKFDLFSKKGNMWTFL